jgi:hypothetical protein
MQHELLEDLIKLSNIFKDGYTVTLNNDSFNQYSNANKQYIVSYRTLITIDKNTVPFKIVYHKIKDLNLNKCIIGAWLNTDTNIYYIELNKTFKSMTDALKFAYKHKQIAIYNMNNQKVINVSDWNTKIKKWLNIDK